MSFTVDNRIELRSDNADLCGYKVFLDDKIYVLYYDKDRLREVYFMARFDNYFMSCRTDMKTVSHYYIMNEGADGKSFIKRYENGIHDRTYLVERYDIVTCVIDGVKRAYTLKQGPGKHEHRKLYSDLVSFLEQFNSLGLFKLFSPQEPV